MQATELRESITSMGRIVHALLLREIRVRFGQRRIGYAWAMIEPALHVGVLYLLKLVVGAFTPAHIPLVLWLASGIIPFLMFRNMVSRIATIAKGSQDVLILPPVQLSDIVIARALLEFLTSTLIFVLALALYTVLVAPLTIANPLLVAGCLALLALSGIGLGMVEAVATAFFPSTKPLVDGLLRVLYLISGVIFALPYLPPEYQAYLSWNPLLHLFENLHAALFAEYQPLAYGSSLTYAAICCLLLVVSGMALLNRYRTMVMANA